MEKNKNKRYLKIGIMIVCAFILLTTGKQVFIRHFFNERLTMIPDVVNLNEKDAIRYLKRSGLNVKVIKSKTEKVPVGTVFIQFPAGNKEVKVNRLIQIWVNSGQGEKVPEIVGLELLEARAMLQSQNIQIEKIDYQPSNQKYNTILGVYPKPGTVLEVNQKISILVSSQKVLDSSIMPNLIGLNINDARVMLSQLGLILGSTSKGEDQTLPANTVISTNPEPGSKISKGQKISLVINNEIKFENKELSVEEIINQTNQQLNNQEIENIINETLDKIDKKGNTQSPTSTPENDAQKN